MTTGGVIAVAPPVTTPCQTCAFVSASKTVTTALAWVPPDGIAADHEKVGEPLVTGRAAGGLTMVTTGGSENVTRLNAVHALGWSPLSQTITRQRIA